VATDDELLALLGQALAPVPREPTAERILALRRVVAERRTPPAPARPGRPAWWLAAAAAAVVVLALGTTAGLRSTRREAPVEFEAALQGESGMRAQATGTKLDIGRVVHLTSDELPILPTGEFYEVWFVGPGDGPGRRNRISAGTFHPDEQGRTDVDLTAAVDPTKYPELSITAEPGDGDPAPGREVLRATVQLR